MESTSPSVIKSPDKQPEQSAGSNVTTPSNTDSKPKPDHDITVDAAIPDPKQEEDEEGIFDPFKKADFNEAENHRRAKLIHKLEGRDLSKCQRCTCCGLPIDAQNFRGCDPIIDLKELGPGFPQYFYVVKYIGAVLIMCMIIAGFACWIDNLAADRSDDWTDESDNFTIRSSVGSQGNKDQIMPFWHSVLHVVVMILMLISYFWLRGYLRRKDEEIDLFITTPSDYTIWVKNLPLDINEQEIKDFFSNNTVPGTTVEIIKVNFPYDIREFVEATRERNAIKEQLAVIKEYKRENPGSTELPKKSFLCFKRQMESEESLRKRKAIYTEKLNKFNNDIAPGVGRDLQIGQAFVTYKHQGDARIAAERFGQNVIYRLLARCCSVRNRNQGSLLFKKKLITATMAPEPTDILWENLGVSKWENFKKQSITYLVSFLALCASFGMVYGCSYYQDKVQDDYDDKSEDDKSAADEWKVRINSIWPSIIIVIINFMLGRAIRYFSSFEKHHTFTYYNTSVGIKLTAAQCINTALITIIVNMDWEDDWFVSGGLVVDMTFVLLSNAFVAPLLYVLSPMYIIKRIKQRKAINNPLILQGEANLLWEEPQVDMPQRYANSFKTLIVTLSYAPILPLGILISIVGIIVQYWVDKMLLIKRHSRPARLSGALADAMVRIIPFAILIYAIMNYVFMWKLNSEDSYVAFVWMWIVVSYFVLPINMMLSCCRKKDISLFQSNQEDFETASVDFVDDYDRCNPVTAEKAYAAYLDFLVKRNMIDAEHVNAMMPTEESKPEQPTGAIPQNRPVIGTLASSIHMYASSRVSLESYEKSTYGAGVYNNPRNKSKNKLKDPHAKPENKHQSKLHQARLLAQDAAKKNKKNNVAGYNDVGHASNFNPYANSLVQFRPGPYPGVYPGVPNQPQQPFRAGIVAPSPYVAPQPYNPAYPNASYVASQPSYQSYVAPQQSGLPYASTQQSGISYATTQPSLNYQQPQVPGFTDYQSYPGQVPYSNRYGPPQPGVNQYGR
jgi:hypothetical protein